MYWSARSSSWPGVAALQQLAEARHLAQRLLQVVRGDVGELLEVGVRARELAAAAVELLASPFGVGQLADDEHAHRLDVLAELGDLAGAGGEHLVVQVAVRHLPDLAGEPVRRRDHDAAQPLQQRQDAERDHHQGHGADDGERVGRAVEAVAGVVAQRRTAASRWASSAARTWSKAAFPTSIDGPGTPCPAAAIEGSAYVARQLRGGVLDGLELRERLGPAPDERAEPGDQLGLVGTPAGVGVEELGARQEDVAAHPGLLVDGGGVELLGGEQGGVEAVHELAALPGQGRQPGDPDEERDQEQDPERGAGDQQDALQRPAAQAVAAAAVAGAGPARPPRAVVDVRRASVVSSAIPVGALTCRTPAARRPRRRVAPSTGTAPVPSRRPASSPGRRARAPGPR